MVPHITIIHETESKWGRTGIIKFIDNQVHFDCSDGEYGPVEFDLKILIDTLNVHINKLNNENK